MNKPSTGSGNMSASVSSTTKPTATPSTCTGCGTFSMFISALKTQNGISSNNSWKNHLPFSTGWKQDVNLSSKTTPNWTKPSAK